MRLFLTYLPFIGCAGVMALCVRMMRGHGRDQKRAGAHRIEKLEMENARLRAQAKLWPTGHPARPGAPSVTAKKAKRRTRTPSRSNERASGTRVARADANKEEARQSRREEARRYSESIRRKAVRRRYYRSAAYGLIAVAVV